MELSAALVDMRIKIMGNTFTLALVMMMFIIYTVVGGMFALVWAVRSILSLIFQTGRYITDKLLPGWL